MKYVFYYDETFHDRKMVLNPEKMNYFGKDNLDDYVGFFWGCKHELINSYVDQLTSFEKKHRSVFGLEPEKELKSTTIKPKNYHFGIRSFLPNTLGFYTELFTLLSKWDYYIQLAMISKTELFIRKALQTVDFPKFANQKVFIYNLTKLIELHKPRELIKAMYDVSEGAVPMETFWSTLVTTLDAIISVCKGVARQYQTIPAYEEMKLNIALFDCDPQITGQTDFDYSLPFNGLSRLLAELKIKPKDIKLTIDREEKTYRAAENFDFGRVKQGESDCSIKIRLSDWLGGFVGRMIRAMKNDKNYQETELFTIDNIDKREFERKHLLSDEWFDLNEVQFNLYRLVCDTLVKQHNHWWTAYSLTYRDDVIGFFSLLSYFFSYDTFEQYKAVPLQMHKEYYNNRTVKQVEQYYKQIC